MFSWNVCIKCSNLYYIRSTEVNKVKLILQTVNYLRNSVWKCGRKVQNHCDNNAFWAVGSFYRRTLYITIKPTAFVETCTCNGSAALENARRNASNMINSRRALACSIDLTFIGHWESEPVHYTTRHNIIDRPCLVILDTIGQGHSPVSVQSTGLIHVDRKTDRQIQGRRRPPRTSRPTGVGVARE